MVLTDIYAIFEQRKRKMESMLKGKNGVSTEKRQELQGAVNEIDMFLNTIDYYSKIPKNVPEPNLDTDTPIEDRSFISKIFKK